MTAILEKRTSESITYDIDCTGLLNAGETIVSVSSVDADQTGLTFGQASINQDQITYNDGRVASIGKVASVKISGGVIAVGATEENYTIRVKFNTSESNLREATVVLKITDKAS